MSDGQKPLSPLWYVGWAKSPGGVWHALESTKHATKAGCYDLLMAATELTNRAVDGMAFAVLPEGVHPGSQEGGGGHYRDRMMRPKQ